MKLKKTSKGLLLACLCVVIAGVWSVAQAGDWPNWRGPNHDGISTETGWSADWPKDGPKQLWTASVEIGFSTMVISDGRCYTMGNTGKEDSDESTHLDIVYCFDAETGKEIWTHKYSNRLDPKYYEGGTLATPTVSGGWVYTISKDGKTFCLNSKTGKVKWEKDLIKDLGFKRITWGFSSSPLVIDNTVIFNVGSWGFALNKNDSSLAWQNGKDESGYATAVPFELNNEKGIAIFGKDMLYGVERQRGSILWKFPWKTKYDVNASDPIFFGNKVFISSGYGRGCALLEVNGTEVKKLWENKNMRSQLSGPVLIDGFLYGIDNEQLACISFETGEVKWIDESIGKGSLMAADGKLIVLSEDGVLMTAVATPKEFKPISKAKVLSGRCWTMPILANGRIYVRNTAGDVICMDVKSNAASERSQGSSNSEQRRGREWFENLSDEEQAWLRNRWENPTEEERAEGARMRERWQNASEEEKKQLQAQMNKWWEKIIKEMKEALSSKPKSSSNNWPQWQGPDRDAISKETGLLKKWPDSGPKLIWSRNDLGGGFSSVSIADGIIYITGLKGDQGVMTAMDLDGSRKWQQPYGMEWTSSHAGSRTTPTIDGDRVYTFSGNGIISCLDTKNGEMIWSVDTLEKFEGKNLRWGMAESVLIDGDKVICTPGGKDASLVALDKMTGKTIWTTKGLSEKSAFCSPILVERGSKRLIVTMLAESVVGIDIETGKPLWSTPVKAPGRRGRGNNPVTPVYLDGSIYTTSGYDKGGEMFELSSDGSAVTSKWYDETLDVHHGGVVVVDGYIYGSRYKGNWVCLDWNSGQVKYEDNAKGKGSITTAEGMLYCYDEKGTVTLAKASPESFDIVSSFDVTLGEGNHWAHPVILNGRLYVRHGDVLMVYDIKAG